LLNAECEASFVANRWIEHHTLALFADQECEFGIVGNRLGIDGDDGAVFERRKRAVEDQRRIKMRFERLIVAWTSRYPVSTSLPPRTSTLRPVTAATRDRRGSRRPLGAPGSEFRVAVGFDDHIVFGGGVGVV